MLPRIRRRARNGRREHTSCLGFTLIEVMVVIAVIATLATLVAPSVFRNVGDARSATARSQVEILSSALESYRMDNLAYPTTEQGLQALRVRPADGAGLLNWRGPYLRKNVPDDPWGRPYHYVSPGKYNPESYDLYTLGRDGLAGGEGEDADITSWGGAIEP
ncbi:MAG TPA: type II secretion system major pseudopilin GspG [Longimicrobiales bacterium]